MLLTEDDLQAVTDYVVAKRRLTNRYVFGAGVVCGLDVTCDPCEPGSVVGRPGLRASTAAATTSWWTARDRSTCSPWCASCAQRTGVDCGEPCEDQPCQDYVLNVVYAEQPTDPVAPYAEDDCAVGDCEFSRVREGYRFELSCDAAPGRAAI